MKKRLLSAVVLSCMLTLSGTIFAAPADSVTNEEQVQTKKTIADLEKEIKDLRERVGKVESVKAEKKEAKAEKKETKPNITFSGDSRTRYIDKHSGGSTVEERIRLSINADVSKDIKFYGRMMLLDNNEMGTTGTKDRVQMIDGNFTHANLFGANYFTLGRFSQSFLATKFWAETNGRIDGVKAGFGNKLKLNVAYANWTPATTTAATYKLATVGGVPNVSVLDKAEKILIGEALFLDASCDVGENTTLYGMWLKEAGANLNPFDVRGIGIKAQLSDDVNLLFDYTDNVANTKGVGYYYSLRYKEANKANPNSWGLRLDYRKVEANNNVSAITGVAIPVADVKGPAISAHYAPAKNWVLNAYQTFNSKKANGTQTAPEYTRFEAIYNF